MWWFVTGFALGWALGGWYQRTGRQNLGRELGQLQARARGALAESARIVEESKRELQSAVGTGAPESGSRPPARRRSSPRRQRPREEGGATD
ncbi:MAG TPA: hypothetical protein VGL23_18295 [Chloroflexota bacterium]|jgi:hypothetical protein